MVWHQFIIVQFPGHQFDWKVRSVQLGARLQSAFVQFGSVQFIQFISRAFLLGCEVGVGAGKQCTTWPTWPNNNVDVLEGKKGVVNGRDRQDTWNVM